MICNPSQVFILLLLLLFPAVPTSAQKACFTPEARALAEQKAKVWQEPDPDYDPVLGFNPKKGPRLGAPPVDSDGLAKPVNCVANKKPKEGAGTLPKFYCSVPGVVDEDGDLIRYKVKPHFKGQSRDKRNGEVYGEFLSSRFSKALGFFADDEWVADVTCPDCEKRLELWLTTALPRGKQGWQTGGVSIGAAERAATDFPPPRAWATRVSAKRAASSWQMGFRGSSMQRKVAERSPKCSGPRATRSATSRRKRGPRNSCARRERSSTHAARTNGRWDGAWGIRKGGRTSGIKKRRFW